MWGKWTLAYFNTRQKPQKFSADVFSTLPINVSVAIIYHCFYSSIDRSIALILADCLFFSSFIFLFNWLSSPCLCWSKSFHCGSCLRYIVKLKHSFLLAGHFPSSEPILEFGCALRLSQIQYMKLLFTCWRRFIEIIWIISGGFCPFYKLLWCNAACDLYLCFFFHR